MKTQAKILDAAAELILEHGVSNVTLEKIAKRAEISKGGLLYHYRTKEALFQELNVAAIQDFEESIARNLNEQPNGRGAFARAYALATIEDIQKGGTHRSSALISIFSDHPEIMGIWKEGYVRWQQQFDQDGLEWEEAATIRYVCDGLWFNEMAGTISTAAFAADLLHSLLARIDKREGE
ncbi:TetR/AcrR family transcriptional regulator [Terribacillus saccharophilus]|uniref:TetR/AcrR family transcriptional regulator n=1 Tax=Terribacillus saccharophilus TaxID=361277 RepID=UPI003981CCDF